MSNYFSTPPPTPLNTSLSPFSPSLLPVHWSPTISPAFLTTLLIPTPFFLEEPDASLHTLGCVALCWGTRLATLSSVSWIHSLSHGFLQGPCLPGRSSPSSALQSLCSSPSSDQLPLVLGVFSPPPSVFPGASDPIGPTQTSCY